MEATSYFRVERGGQSFGGNGQSFESRQHQKRHKFHALVDAIGSAELSQARQILQTLFNLEPMLRSDPLFLKLGRALEENNVHAAEHFVKEVRGKALVTLSKRSTHQKDEAHKPIGLEHHLIDLQA
jgi:hypothetical protein